MNRLSNHSLPALWLAPAIAAIAAVYGSACTPTCTDDLDCPRGALQCVEGTCSTLPPNAPEICSVTADCQGGRVCVDAECRYAPSCQTILSGAPFAYVASCATGGTTTGSASPTTSGCQISFAMQGLGGANRSVQVGPLSGETTEVSGLSTTAGDVVCTTGAWNGAASTLLLTDCDVGGDTCDVMLSRQRNGATFCLDDGACGGETCAPDVQVGATIAGRCQ